MRKLTIKPFSVNDAWKGKRYRTNAYKLYKDALNCILEPMPIPEGNIKLELVFGFQTNGSDIDNPVKCFTDVISEYYGFNDNRITELHVIKKKAGRGKEYILYNITSADG